MFGFDVGQQLVNGLPEVLAALLAVENGDKIVFCRNVHLPLLGGTLGSAFRAIGVGKKRCGGED